MADMFIRSETVSGMADSIRKITNTEGKVNIGKFAKGEYNETFYEGKYTVSGTPIKDGVTVVPLIATANGVYEYDSYYETATKVWDSNTEYDGSITVDGLELSFKKAENLIVPDDLDELKKSKYIATVESEELDSPQTAPINDAIVIVPGIVASLAEYAVVWVKKAAPLNADFGVSFLEDNTVYITNYIQLINGENYIKLSITAPSRKVENVAYQPVTVNVPTYITVASVDDLPTDSEDGTIAIVEG